MKKFNDRKEAGQLLAKHPALQHYKNQPNVIVLGLARGGMPVAYEVANDLQVPLDVFIVRKLGVPGHEELAMGAIATGGQATFNPDVVESLHIPPEEMQAIVHKEAAELERREIVYRGERPYPNLTHKTVILVDDGVATGASIRAAIQAIQQHGPDELIVAVPTSAYDTAQVLKTLVDQFICLIQPHDFFAVGYWYESFDQTTDEEVIGLLLNASPLA